MVPKKSRWHSDGKLLGSRLDIFFNFCGWLQNKDPRFEFCSPTTTSRRLMHPRLGLCVSFVTPKWIATATFNCVGHNVLDLHLPSKAWQLILRVHVLQDCRHVRRRIMSGARIFKALHQLGCLCRQTHLYFSKQNRAPHEPAFNQGVNNLRFAKGKQKHKIQITKF